MNSIKLIPIKVERQTSQFNLIDCLLDSLNRNSQKLLDNDILIISSKFVSLSEGRFVKLSDIPVSSFADKISKKYNEGGRRPCFFKAAENTVLHIKIQYI